MSADQKFEIKNLGTPTFKSPLGLSSVSGDKVFNFVKDSQRIIKDVRIDHSGADWQTTLEKAGPRENLYFEPSNTTAAIVTCGGLCPGLNNVIRSIVMSLHYFYDVKKIIGIPYGYEGLNPEMGQHQRVSKTFRSLEAPC